MTVGDWFIASQIWFAAWAIMGQTERGAYPLSVPFFAIALGVMSVWTKAAP